MPLEQTELLKKFAKLVVEKNKIHNLTSAKTPEEFYKKHIKDCRFGPKRINMGTVEALGRVWAPLWGAWPLYTGREPFLPRPAAGGN